jgi:molecular chaperone GrpE
MIEVERDDCEPGIVVQELISGYTLHDRLLRPAMVGVSKKVSQNDDISDEKSS